MLETEYSVTAGRFVRGMTYFVIILFLALLIIIPYFIYLDEGLGAAFYATLAILLAVYIPLLILSWAFSPSKYIVSEEGVKIERPLRPLFIPMETIKKVEEKDFRNYKLIRKFGNGGLFSQTGSFWNKKEGTMYFYAKNSNYVMIYADKKYVLSPDERFQFINHLRKYMREKNVS